MVSYEEVKENFLSRVETFTMGTTLDMNLNPIINLKDPTLGKEPATKDYADEKLSKAGKNDRFYQHGNSRNHEPGNPTGNSNAATKKYVDDVDAKVSTKIDIGEIDQKTKKSSTWEHQLPLLMLPQKVMWILLFSLETCRKRNRQFEESS